MQTSRSEWKSAGFKDGRPDGVLQAWNAERTITLILRGEEFGPRSGEGDSATDLEMTARHIGAYETKGLNFIA